MGYRSNVGYAIRFRDVQSLQEFVGIHAINEHTREALEECDLFLGSSDDCPELSFYSENTKWYASFEEVQAHESLLAFVEDMDDPYAGYMFIRIGEEDDDLETKYGGDNGLIPSDTVNLSRHIVMDTGPTVRSDKGTIAIVSEAHSGQTTNS